LSAPQALRRAFPRNGPNSATNSAGLAAQSYAGTHARRARWNNVMHENNNGTFGIIVGGVFAVIAAIFILTGGELGGKKTVKGDQDLPPVSSSTE
jgi:hypothetical protein